MLLLKTIANTLTVFRFLIGFIIAFIISTQKKSGLRSAIFWLITAWLTDILDGFLARTSKAPEDWIGKHDLYADMTVSAGVLYYLTSSGFVSIKFTISFLIISIILLWRFRSKSIADGIQAVPYGLMIYTSFKYQPFYGYLIIIYLLLIILITWPRFPKEKVPEFINGIKELFKK